MLENCFCVCHDPVASNAYCEHCKGNNNVGNYWRNKNMSISGFDSYFVNRNVSINWERIVIPKGSRIFKIVSHFNLYNESYIIIKPIDEHKEILVKLYDIKSMTLI